MLVKVNEKKFFEVNEKVPKFTLDKEIEAFHGKKSLAELLKNPAELLPLGPVMWGMLHMLKSEAFAYQVKPPKGSGVAEDLWPLAEMLQSYGLTVGICISLFGLLMYIMGSPEGKEKIRSALIGFIGLFIIPQLFFSLWEAFH